MFLAQIEPDEPGRDLRIFECSECGNVLTKVVRYNLALAILASKQLDLWLDSRKRHPVTAAALALRALLRPSVAPQMMQRDFR